MLVNCVLLSAGWRALEGVLGACANSSKSQAAMITGSPKVSGRNAPMVCEMIHVRCSLPMLKAWVFDLFLCMRLDQGTLKWDLPRGWAC